MDNVFWVNETGVTADKVFDNDAKPPAHAALLNCNMNSGTQGATKNGFGYLENRGKADDDFIRTMLEPLREARVWLPESGTDGATNVQIHRVICSSGKGSVGVEFRAGQ